MRASRLPAFKAVASPLCVTRTISQSGYSVARGSLVAQASARLRESVGMTMETRGQAITSRRARFAVGYSIIWAGKFRRRIASANAARLLARAFGLAPNDPELACSRQRYKTPG